MSVDMISALPDDVLVRILSFLPLNTAGATSILSRRWLHLWNYRTKLDFTNRKLTMPNNPQLNLRYVNWVNSVIKSHKGPLQEFTVDFRATKSNRNHVAKWLEFAFSRRVEKLDLKWYGFTITKDDVALLLEEVITLQSSTGIQFLKELCLRLTKTSADAIRFFLLNCPMLENLVIKNAIITSSEVEIVSSSLKYLDILPYNKNISIKVSAPNLTFLRIDYDSKKVFLENVPKLVHMHFGCRFHSTMHDFATVASQLEILAISMDSPKASFSVPAMPKLKKLAVGDSYYGDHGPIVPIPITCFLTASPCLEEFDLKINGLTFEEDAFEVPKVGPSSQHSSLKRFKLWWWIGGRSPGQDRIKLVRYVVDNCVALQEIYISKCDQNLGLDRRYVVRCVRRSTPKERFNFEKTVERPLQHIKLRVIILKAKFQI